MVGKIKSWRPMINEASVSGSPLKKVLVTGSSGMLGIDLCNILGGSFSLIGLDIRELKCVNQFIKADIRDKINVLDAVKHAKPDIIVHTAAWTDVDGCEFDHLKALAINVEGTRNIVLAAKSSGCPLIYVSTDYVFDGKKSALYSPNDKTNPMGFYAKTKLDGENIVSGLKEYSIIRTSWLYGKNGKNFVDTIISKAVETKNLKIVDDQTGSPTFTKDLSRAMKVFLDKYFSGMSGLMNRVYHVSNTGVISWFGFAKYILESAGIKDVQVSPISTKELGRPSPRPAFSGLDVSDFEMVTGHKLRNWQEGLKEYLNERT